MRTMEARRCAICERTLLVGEQIVRFAPDGVDEFVDVCPLCQETALDHGWVREGSPIGPAVRNSRRRRSLTLGAILGGSRRPAAETIVAEPLLRRLSGEEQAMVEAAALFNASEGRRTVEGIARSLGEPRVSVVPLRGPNQDIVLTFVWEISWYQYRVTAEATQPVRLAERGLEPGELDASSRTGTPGSSRAPASSRTSRIRGSFRPTHPYNEMSGDDEPVIYCVIPRELEAELFDKMVAYYEDNPNVTVIVDRRSGPDRRRDRGHGGLREIRDRRRARATGTFPRLDVA